MCAPSVYAHTGQTGTKFIDNFKMALYDNPTWKKTEEELEHENEHDFDQYLLVLSLTSRNLSTLHRAAGRIGGGDNSHSYNNSNSDINIDNHDIVSTQNSSGGRSSRSNNSNSNSGGKHSPNAFLTPDSRNNRGTEPTTTLTTTATATSTSISTDNSNAIHAIKNHIRQQRLKSNGTTSALNSSCAPKCVAPDIW